MPGHPRVGGIRKGQKKRTQEMVNRIFDIVESDFWDDEQKMSTFMMDMGSLSPRDRRDVMLKLLKIIMPSISSVAIEDNTTVSSIRQLMENMAAYKRENT